MSSLFRSIAMTCVLVATTAPAAAKTPSAAQLLRHVDHNEGFKTNYGEMKQIITTTSGQERTLVLRAWSVRNGEKQLAEYLAPADIKGQKILMTNNGDNIWMYNPETRRTRKLGSHMRKRKVMGSDFSYEDQAGGEFSQKFTGGAVTTETIEGVPCYQITLTPTARGPSYDKIIAWVGQADWVMRRVDYYQDGEDTPFKRLIGSDVRKVSGKKIAYRMTMTNLRDQTKTVNVITRIVFGAKIPQSIFESRNLER